MNITKTSNQFNLEGLKILQSAKIYVAGHQGMVGSALLRALRSAGCENLILRSRRELNLENQQQVQDFMLSEKPGYVFLAAAKVGGIYANQHYPATFIYQNTMIAANLINAAHLADVQNLLFLGSSCIYPSEAAQPMKESALLTGTLEPTNEPYAIAKIAGIKMCESYNREFGRDFRSAMPTNLYGSHDNFDLKTSHVLAALLRKFHEGKLNNSPSVEIWGTGKPKREFMHVDDLADACLFLACLSKDQYASHTHARLSHVNVGTGTDVTIAELARMIKQTTGFEGELEFNTQYPDGARQKLLDVSTLSKLGWQAQIDLKQGLQSTYQWFLANHK